MSTQSSAIEKLYAQRLATPSDISEHMPRLRELASECTHITEFGVRTGNSTVAFLAALDYRVGLLVSYDLNMPSVALPDGLQWNFYRANTAHLQEISGTDLLFIDTLHTAAQVEAELEHGNRAAKYLVFHDTVLFGTREETDMRSGPGIMHPILCFMAKNRHWQVKEHHANNNGLLVLERKPAPSFTD